MGSFPSTSVLDDFNRANESPPMTGWTTWLSNGLNVQSNVVGAVDSGDNGAYWTTAMTGPDVEGYVAISTLPVPGAGVGVSARGNPTGAGFNGTRYMVFYDGSGTISISRHADAVDTLLGGPYSRALSAGDKIGIRCIGSTIEAWTSVSGVWTRVGSIIDTTYPGTGSQNKLALYITGSSSPRLDNFGGGTIITRTNTFNGGTDGVVLTDANSDDVGSGDAFQVAGAEWFYTNVQSHSGGMAVRCVDPTDVSKWFRWTALGGGTLDTYSRFYLYMPSLPTDNNFYPLNIRTSADSSSAILRILSAGNGGIIQMRDASNSLFGSGGTVAVATGKWVRIETRVRSNGASSEMEYRLFNNADSVTPSETESASGTLGANSDMAAFGINVARPLTFTSYIDDVAFSTMDWIGPAEADSAVYFAPVIGGYGAC